MYITVSPGKLAVYETASPKDLWIRPCLQRTSRNSGYVFWTLDRHFPYKKSLNNKEQKQTQKALIYFNIILFISFNRSSHPEVFCQKCVLKNFAKFTGKHLCQSLCFNKVAGLRRPVNFCQFCEISKNTFLYRTTPVATSETTRLFI